MSDREALLAAIRANPDDDTPRLMFADWLDEHDPDARPRAKKKTKGKKGKGEPKAPSPSSWASLIRAECEFERLRTDGSAAAEVYDHFETYDAQTLGDVRWERALPEVARRVELRDLIPALRTASKKSRAAGMKAKPGASWGHLTHRGFPEGLHAGNSLTFLSALPSLIESVPRVRLGFHKTKPVLNPDELVAAGLARWCRALSVQGTAEHAKLVAAMSNTPDTTGVRQLQVQRGWQTEDYLDQILASVAESPHWSGLRELELTNSFDVPAGLAGRLFGAKHLRGLRRLSLNYGGRLTEVVESLAGMTELRALSLLRCDLDDAAAERLAGMPSLANLRSLHLQFNQLTGRGALALLTSPHLRNLAVLDLEGNSIRGLDKKALAKAPAGGLRILSFQSNRLSGADVVAVVSSPRVSELMFFAACYNPFPESTVARLVKGFGKRAPAVLYLMGNRITTEGAKALANWPAAEQIDMLHLSSNTLSVTGAKAIAGCPHLQQLNHICAGCKSDKAGEILRRCFGDRADV